MIALASPEHYRPTPVPTIIFQANRVGREKSVEAPKGGALVDICDEALAPVPFSCRSATCATCHIEIVRGAELLVPPDEDERELLDVLNAPDTSRLACQVVVHSGPGTLCVRPVDE